MIGVKDVDKALGVDFVGELQVSMHLRKEDQRRLRARITAAVNGYIELKTEPSPARLSAELHRLRALADKALRLCERRTPRPGEYRNIIGQISTVLAGLSEPGRDMLVEPVDDPIKEVQPAKQRAALLALYGATAGRNRPKQNGRPTYRAERYLYSMLAAAFIQATEKSANAQRSDFTDLCESVKERCKLKDFNWESMERATRKGKVTEEFLDLDEEPNF